MLIDSLHSTEFNPHAASEQIDQSVRNVPERPPVITPCRGETSAYGAGFPSWFSGLVARLLLEESPQPLDVQPQLRCGEGLPEGGRPR
ncbi:hypothetical protein [Stratiformator vulcanicus]|uniref:Uncharacterized protein n=1 Tax=Stratiformator vulcanicus TaxID=2527980 RepID=A0A517QXX0_9PLAN|nr:hypothetical protein [Stratiformator vulcanicus]QDT36454.1 hypothetical protein Pan189_08100 [Stratiformator vulcanicus]